MKNSVFALILTATLFGVAPMVYAEGGTAAPAAVTTSSVPTPEITTLDGTVSGLDAVSSMPWIKVKDASGKEEIVMLDAASSTAWKGGVKVTWADVKVGEKVKVRYTAKDGKSTVKTVEIA